MSQTLEELLIEFQISSPNQILDDDFYINKFNEYIQTYTHNINVLSKTALSQTQLQTYFNTEYLILINYMNLYQEYLLNK